MFGINFRTMILTLNQYSKILMY